MCVKFSQLCVRKKVVTKHFFLSNIFGAFLGSKYLQVWIIRQVRGRLELKDTWWHFIHLRKHLSLCPICIPHGHTHPHTHISQWALTSPSCHVLQNKLLKTFRVFSFSVLTVLNPLVILCPQNTPGTGYWLKSHCF